MGTFLCCCLLISCSLSRSGSLYSPSVGKQIVRKGTKHVRGRGKKGAPRSIRKARRGDRVYASSPDIQDWYLVICIQGTYQRGLWLWIPRYPDEEIIESESLMSRGRVERKAGEGRKWWEGLLPRLLARSSGLFRA